MRKFFPYLLGGSIGIVSGLCYYYFRKNKKSKNNKNTLQSLLEGNERYIKNNRKFFKPILNHTLIINLDKDINAINLLDTKFYLYNVYDYDENNFSNNTFEFIDHLIRENNINTFVVLSKNDNKDMCKNFLNYLVKDSEYISKYVEEGVIKPYWATYNENNKYVTFRHLM